MGLQGVIDGIEAEGLNMPSKPGSYFIESTISTDIRLYGEDNTVSLSTWA